MTVVGIQLRYHTPRDPKSCWAILILLAPTLAFGAFHPWWLIRPSPVFLRPKDQEHPSKKKKEKKKQSQTVYKYTHRKTTTH